MAKGQQSVVVTQMHNARYSDSNPGCEEPYTYYVDKTVNRMVPAVKTYVTRVYLEGLIDEGVTVTVVPVK